MKFPNNRLNQSIGFALISVIALLLGGCHSMSLHGKPFFNQEPFKADPPRTLAILPTTDDSGHPELKPLVRVALLGSIAPLPYDDKELREVDEFLAKKAAKAAVAPDKLAPEAMTDPALADCVLYSRITRVSRVYLVLYAHYRIDLDLVMVDTRNRQVLYRNHFTFYDRLGAPTFVSLPFYSITSFVGVAGSSVQSLWHLRSGRLEETFEEGAKKIAQELPVPPDLDRSGGGGIRLASMEVVKPFATLGPGERVIVKAQATPGCRSTFNIGQVACEVPMQENTPGSYMGIYEVKPGDNAEYALVELRLARGAEALEHADEADAFAIDTTPPPRARVSWAGEPLLGSGVLLRFELDPSEATQNKDKKLEYHVYRKTGGEKYERIGVSAKPAFHDSKARHGKAETYYVITKDGAGNLSPMWEMKTVNVG